MVYHGNMDAQQVKAALQEKASPKKAKASAWFFKTGPGQYGEGDQFIGVTVPEQHLIAKTFRDLPLPDSIQLLRSPIHEHRLTGLFILVDQYRRGDAIIKKEIASIYHKNRANINNWDLVDSSAPYILGDYLKNHSPNVLIRFASSKSLWDRRIAIISTFAWVKDGDLEPTLKIAEMLLQDRVDLIHKAVGWALREVGKKDEAALHTFLKTHLKSIPRTTLRYAIERLSPEDRQIYMRR